MSTAPSETARIFELLRSFAPVDRESVDGLLAGATSREYRRGQQFLASGDSADAVGFVAEGLFKACCDTADGHVYIRNFCSAGYFIGAFAAAIRGAPSDVTIEAVERSRVVGVRYANLHALFDRSTAWQEFGRKLAEWHYIEREVKEYRLLACTALERYDAFRAENAHVLGRVSQADIASYIGVAPESLSRMLRARGTRRAR